MLTQRPRPNTSVWPTQEGITIETHKVIAFRRRRNLRAFHSPEQPTVASPSPGFKGN